MTPAAALMTAADAQRRQWTLAVGIALGAHLAVAGLALAWTRPAVPPVIEPVVLVELPPEGAGAPQADPASTPADSQPQAVPEQVRPLAPSPQLEVPQVRAPVPRDAINLPAPAPVAVSAPVRQAPPAAVQPVAAAATAAAAAQGTGRGASGSGASETAGTDPRAKKQEADYFSLISAHLNRRKVYPTEAKKARQQGIVTVRFTVDRNGNVSGTSIKRSSGFAILDDATLDLLRRVAPLPRMPATMQRDSVTLSLPIDYSLRTS